MSVTERAPQDQADYMTITKVILHEAHEGIEVVSGYIGNDCGCIQHLTLYKTMVLGLTPRMIKELQNVIGGYPALPWHLHQIRPVTNHSCAHAEEEMIGHHKSALKAVDAMLHRIIEERQEQEGRCTGCANHCVKEP